MHDVSYQHQFDYLSDGGSSSFPGIRTRISLPADPANGIEVVAHLDSGAQQSIFDGEISQVIGLDLMSGRPQVYQSTSRGQVNAMLHNVRLSHPILGTFDLEVGLTTTRIYRNLLGRDFFNLFQVGFRERYRQFLLTPE